MSSSRRAIAYGKENIDFSLFHVDRKTLEIAVHPDQTVVVKAPLGIDDEEIRTTGRPGAPVGSSGSVAFSGNSIPERRRDAM